MALRSILVLAFAAVAAGFVPGVVSLQHTAVLHSRPVVMMGNPIEDAMAMVSSFFKQVCTHWPKHQP